jgi:hypothetical protein
MLRAALRNQAIPPRTILVTRHHVATFLLAASGQRLNKQDHNACHSHRSAVRSRQPGPRPAPALQAAGTVSSSCRGWRSGFDLRAYRATRIRTSHARCRMPCLTQADVGALAICHDCAAGCCQVCRAMLGGAICEGGACFQLARSVRPRRRCRGSDGRPGWLAVG